MNNKEFKEKWSKKTLGEIKGQYEELVRIDTLRKDDIKSIAQKLVNLDFNEKYYADKMKDFSNQIAFFKSYIKDTEKELSILKPILEKKEIEGINQEEYESYITNNVDVKVLIYAVNKLKEEFVSSGSKVLVNLKRNGKIETITIELSKKEVDYMYDTMLKETIMIIKDNIGNFTRAEYIRTNANRGLDGLYIGDKGHITINTIIASGMVQRPHFRTLVYKY